MRRMSEYSKYRGRLQKCRMCNAHLRVKHLKVGQRVCDDCFDASVDKALGYLLKFRRSRIVGDYTPIIICRN